MGEGVRTRGWSDGGKEREGRNEQLEGGGALLVLMDGGDEDVGRGSAFPPVPPVSRVAMMSLGVIAAVSERPLMVGRRGHSFLGLRPDGSHSLSHKTVTGAGGRGCSSSLIIIPPAIQEDTERRRRRGRGG